MSSTDNSERPSSPDRAPKRPRLVDNDPKPDSSAGSSGSEEAAQQHHFSGIKGIVQTGPGSINIGGSAHIGFSARSEDILHKLSTTNPEDDKQRILRTKGGLLEGSYQWVLDNEEFRRWRDDEQTRLLWVKGDPGKGKTMLLCGIIDSFTTQSNETSYNPDCNIIYFFCQAKDERLDNARAVIRGIIYGLIRAQKSLLAKLMDEYKDVGDRLFQDANSLDALSRVLDVILESPDLRQTYLIVDALDECTTELEELLQLLGKLSSPRLKILTASRNWPAIEREMGSVQDGTRLSLEVNSESVATAVLHYINDQVRKLESKHKYDKTTREAVRQHLEANANGTFLWVSLVCKKLMSPRVCNWQVQAKLRNFPPDLDKLYERMINQIFESDDMELCRQVLAVVSLVYTPIRIEQLPLLADEKEIFPDDTVYLQEVIELCGSFLTLRDGVIYFVHQSAADFLMDPSRGNIAKIFPRGVPHQHHTLAERCISAMDSTLTTNNPYGLEPPTIHIKDVRTPDPDPLQAIAYACLHWTRHFIDCGGAATSRCLEDEGLVHCFLKQHLLRWLEACSLAKGGWDLPRALMLFSKAFGDSRGTQLAILLKDAQRFVARHIQLIVERPLQVYGSALLYSPANSVVRRLFEENEIKSLKTKRPAPEDEWDACLMSLEHSSVIVSLALSEDESHILSATRDGVIRMWDSVTGECEKETEHIFPFMAANGQISTDKKRIAFANPDGYAYAADLWKPGTSHLLRLERFDDEPLFTSPDASLVAAHSPKTDDLRIWNIASGRLLCALEYPKDACRPLAYLPTIAISPGNSWVATNDLSHVVPVWDMTTRKLVELPCPVPCTTIAFSLDELLVAFGLEDGRLLIFETKRWNHVQTLTGGLVPRCIEFSHDGLDVFAGFFDGLLAGWEVSSGQGIAGTLAYPGFVEILAVSQGYDRIVTASRSNLGVWDKSLAGTAVTGPKYATAAAMSPDDKRVVTGHLDGNLAFWDAATGRQLSSINMGGRVFDICFSSAGNVVAVVSENEVGLFDGVTAAMLHRIPHNGGGEPVAAFAPNMTLAVGDANGWISLWNKVRETPERHKNLRTRAQGAHFMIHDMPHRHFQGKGYVQSMSFSPDSQLLLCASWPFEVRLWNISTGQCEWAFADASPYDPHGAFSPDGRYVAVNMRYVGSEGFVRFLDVKTGHVVRVIHNTGRGTLSWKSGTGLHGFGRLYTQRGVLDLHYLKDSITQRAQDNNACREPLAISGLGYDDDSSCILIQGRPIFYLPLEYRPVGEMAHLITRGDTLVIVKSRGLMVFRL